MVLALDVHYKEDRSAKAVGVLFDWEDNAPKEIIIDYVEEIEEYIPGEFYKRELPCLLKIIKKIDIKGIDAIIIDGYVYLDNNFQKGLGGILWEKLDQKFPVIGVAKTSFFSNKETVKEIFRGKSQKPLYVSSVGCDINEASEKLKNMSGEFRIPDILKQMDIITKEA